jgi:hypothetical protein
MGDAAAMRTIGIDNGSSIRSAASAVLRMLPPGSAAGSAGSAVEHG